ncbi:MAG TPA: VOC family protein [Burkholderiaceae bacterium]|nr:VOC family protein [Burkholderiaceae bacterium]
MDAGHRAPGDSSSEEQGGVLTVEFPVTDIPCIGLNKGSAIKHNETIDDLAEMHRLRIAIVKNGGQEMYAAGARTSGGVSWQITPRVLMTAISDPDGQRPSARSKPCWRDREDRNRCNRCGLPRLSACLCRLGAVALKSLCPQPTQTLNWT